MDGLTFLVRLVEALVWPGAAMIIAFAFRRELRSLVSLVRKLKAGPLEAEFDREIREISQEVSRVNDIEKREHPDPSQQMLTELARVNPRSAILEAWLGIESAVRKVALQKIATSPAPDVSSPHRAMRQLVQNEIVTPDDAALFFELRGLRNQAAHLEGFNPSEVATLRYISLAAQLVSRLERLSTLN